MVKKSIAALETGDIGLAQEIRTAEEEMNSREKMLRRQHMVRLTQKRCSPEFTVIYTDVVHDIEKIGDYCNNIADAVIENQGVE